jgi:TRAP-type transport system small permease protein
VWLLCRVDDGIAWAEDLFLALATGLLGVLLFANVLLRYVFRSPFAWMEEGVVMVFVWVVFVGVSAAFRTHQHLRIDVLVRFLDARLTAIVGSLAVIVTFVILGFLVKLGYDYALFVANNRTPVLRISAAWIYVGLPLGMALSIVHVLRQALDEGPGEVLKSVLEMPDVPTPGGGPSSGGVGGP